MPVDFKNKTVLITGASGFLGAHIAEELVAREASVVALAHDVKKHSYLVLEGLDKRMDTCHGDITSLERMQEVMANYEVEYVFHCAADAIVRTCSNDPLGCFRVNILGTAIVLEAAR